jgi:hypothetical protein
MYFFAVAPVVGIERDDNASLRTLKLFGNRQLCVASVNPVVGF